MSAIEISPDLEFLNPPENHQDWQTRISLVDSEKNDLFVLPFTKLKIFKGSDGYFYIKVSTIKHYDFLSILPQNPQLQIKWDNQHSISFKNYKKVTSHIEVTAPFEIKSMFYFVCLDYQKHS